MMDEDGCASEAIHTIGLIQPHGLLIAVSETDLVVRYASANLFDLVGATPDEIIDRPIEHLLGNDLLSKLRGPLADDDVFTLNPLAVALGSPARRFACVVHRHDGMLVLEFERQAGAASLQPLNLSTHLQAPIARMESQSDLPEIARVAADEFRRTTGFDRVMIYRFDADWNGQVIAESGLAWPSYLGHHFPATDIPAQARRLFLLNTLRCIVDVDAVAVPIVSSGPKPLDLSQSLLRSASAVHIQYLRNMGVGASLTISILIRGELWGMVTAHHREARRLDFLTRSVCNFFGQTLAAQILARSDNELLAERLASRAEIETYMTSVETASMTSRDGGFDTAPLLVLLGASGVISQIDGVRSAAGLTVDGHRLATITAALRANAAHGIASSNKLAELDPNAADFARLASGALYISLSEKDGDHILILRQELVQTITWAGNPVKTGGDAGSQHLSPRDSFAAWQQTIRGCCEPWNDLQIEKAQLLREQFISARLRQRLRTREITYEAERARSTIFQQAILPPQLPAVPGLAFDAVYDPGMSDEQVGGDWYDAVRLIDGRVLVTIGDVAGNGLRAAVIMGVVRQIMRGIGQLHAEPALMLDAADRALRLEYPDIFVTAWVGIFDLVARTLTYASAGHPPPLLLDATGTIRELDHRTLPIGLRQGHQGFASTIALAHDSTLCLYTDGLIEATHNIIEGGRRLREVMARMGSAKIRHPAAMIRRLVIPKGSPDDVAILTVRTRLAESERCLTRTSFDSADAVGARRNRREFTQSLPDAEFSPNDIANAEVVFGELCGNVTRYAPGVIDVVVDRSGMQTVLHVLDRGAGFRHLSRLPADEFAESGRGLFIISSMTADFTVTQRVDGGSHARAVLVGRYPFSLLREETLPALSDQIAAFF